MGDHLTQGVGVVGVTAHQLPVGMRVKEGKLQALHMIEHIRAQAMHHARGDVDHHTVVGIGRNNADQVDAAHQSKTGKERRQVGVFSADKGLQRVDDALEHIGAEDVGERADEHQHEDQKQHPLPRPEVGEQAADDADRVFRLCGGAAAAATGALGHGSVVLSHSLRPLPLCP